MVESHAIPLFLNSVIVLVAKKGEARKMKIEVPSDLKNIIPPESDTASLIESCIKVLSEQPNYHKVRVFLSKIYYQNGYLDFAIRELLEVKRQGEFPLVERILKELGVGESTGRDATVVAEIKV